MRRLDLWTRYYIRWNPTMQPQVGVILFTHFILSDVEEWADVHCFAKVRKFTP